MTGSSRGPSPAPHRRSGAVGRVFGLAALALVIGAPAAHATGTLDCSIDDAAVAFDAQTAFSYGMGGSFNNFRAVLEVKPAGKGGAPFGKLELDGEALVHHWFHGNEVRLHLYHERPDARAGSAELLIETKSRGKEAESFAGRYVLTLTTVDADGTEKTRTLKGRATCSAG
ncbi:hypothetical protein [Xanthobacter sp. 126]|uniref:hypothetical protein n=1 Tax=Xanthobacter sp. 126 TaxID=1131814 RepID=UPI0012DCAC89|nr:hypothetical protein [Xanthobacter sp. 126]